MFRRYEIYICDFKMEWLEYRMKTEDINIACYHLRVEHRVSEIYGTVLYARNILSNDQHYLLYQNKTIINVVHIKCWSWIF